MVYDDREGERREIEKTKMEDFWMRQKRNQGEAGDEEESEQQGKKRVAGDERRR